VSSRLPRCSSPPRGFTGIFVPQPAADIRPRGPEIGLPHEQRQVTAFNERRSDLGLARSDEALYGNQLAWRRDLVACGCEKVKGHRHVRKVENATQRTELAAGEFVPRKSSSTIWR
jgi:hypothetical protein